MTDSSHPALDTLDWDLLRTFEAIARCGGLTAASKLLGVSQSTVSRQLAKLEASAGSPLFVRETPLRLSERGAALREAIAPMVDASLAARAALEQTPRLQGLVTVHTVAALLRWSLVDALPEFYAAYPELRLRLLAANELSSLAAGEADIALRFVRPTRGELVARKLRSESFAYFTAVSLAPEPALPWLGLAGSLANVPEQRAARAAWGEREPRLLVEDIDALAHACAAGLGVAVLPRSIAAALGGLEERAPEALGAAPQLALPTRELWLVVHHSRQRLPKVRVVMDWLIARLADG